MPRGALLYAGAVLALGWAVALPLYLGPSPRPIPPWIGLLFSLTPALAGGLVYLVAPVPGGLTQALGLRLRPSRWLAAAVLFPVVLALLTLALGLAVPGVRWDPTGAGLLERLAPTLPPEERLRLQAEMEAQGGVALLLGSLVQGVVAGATLQALLALGEEVGWRGVLYRHLAPLGFWRTSLLTGLVWGLWQVPLVLQGVNYPQHPRAGVGMILLFTLLLSPLFTLVRARTGSVAGPALMHGVLNALGAWPLLALRGGSDLTVGLTGASGLVGIALLVAALGAYNRGRGGFTLPPEDADGLDQRGGRPRL